MDDSKSTIGSVSFSTLLVIIFLILKLTNNIDWSWWWIFSPYWIPVISFISIMIITVFISLIYMANTGKSMDEFIKKYTKSNKLLKP